MVHLYDGILYNCEKAMRKLYTDTANAFLVKGQNARGLSCVKRGGEGHIAVNQTLLKNPPKLVPLIPLWRLGLIFHSTIYPFISLEWQNI